MRYRSVADLSQCIFRNLERIPPDVDVIVGIPRSGLLAANLIALSLNLPLADLDGFLAGRLLAAGSARRNSRGPRELTDCKKALIVDDSVLTGGTIARVRQRVEQANPRQKAAYCAIYGHRDGSRFVDLVFEELDTPRIFQWNYMHHSLTRSYCVDIDGVLCRDPLDHENDDGEAYMRFLGLAEPKAVPTTRLGWLVTSRLEKYRKPTERWLNEKQIEYDHLVMLDLPTKAARQAGGSHAAFKAEVYVKIGAVLFVESSLRQAREIAARSGKPVLCTETHELIQPRPNSPRAVHRFWAHRLRDWARRHKAVYRIGRAVLGRKSAPSQGGR